MTQQTLNRLADLGKGFGLLAWLFIFAVGAYCFMNADWVSQSTLDRLPGASRTQVRALLGEPESADDDADGGGIWRYRAAGQFAEFQVWFEPGGQVKEWHYDR